MKTPVAFYIHYLLLAWLSSFVLATHAGLLDQDNNSSSSGVLTNSQPEFLPVRKAYQLTIEKQDTQLLLNWTVAPGYFLYGHQFRVDVTRDQKLLETSLEKPVGEIAWDDYFQQDVERFHHDTTLTVNLPPQALEGSGTLTISVHYQGCAEAGLCYPPEMLYFDMDIESGEVREILDVPSVDTSENTNTSFALMFVFAVLGGLILNLMPCVFPVLTIKLMGFARSNQSESHVREHSWFYTLGVLSTFLLTALLLILLRQSGASIGWGFQLQSPVFIGALAVLFLVLALSMSGFITIGTRLMGVGQQLTEGSHYRHSFFTGVLAVIVASPCSVPFMGIALGYALTQPVYASLVIFMGLGLGLASPFLVFAYVPWLIKHLPKPGPWMESLKHWLALPLYLSTIWLLWVLWQQTVTQAQTDAGRYWEPYSASALESYRDAREPVFVELTADWCITCLVNEKAALARPAVLENMKTNGIHYLRGDWTNRDPEITKLLNEHQRAGVPLYLYYDKTGKLEILPQILTEQRVLETFSR